MTDSTFSITKFLENDELTLFCHVITLRNVHHKTWNDVVQPNLYRKWSIFINILRNIWETFLPVIFSIPMRQISAIILALLSRKDWRFKIVSPPISAVKLNMKRGAYRDSGPKGLIFHLNDTIITSQWEKSCNDASSPKGFWGLASSRMMHKMPYIAS